MVSNTFQLSIPSYGEVKGFINEDLAEVRGIPYAIVPDRFRSPSLCETLSGEVHDGTVFGYQSYTRWMQADEQATMSAGVHSPWTLDSRDLSENSYATTRVYVGWIPLHQSQHLFPGRCCSRPFPVSESSCDGQYSRYRTPELNTHSCKEGPIKLALAMNRAMMERV